MSAAQHELVAEAMALHRCYTENGYSEEQCASQRKAYESHVAGFRMKYGK